MKRDVKERIFFFWPKTGTSGVGLQRYPGSIRTHEVPGTGTAGFLPYRCFLACMFKMRQKLVYTLLPV